MNFNVGMGSLKSILITRALRNACINLLRSYFSAVLLDKL